MLISGNTPLTVYGSYQLYVDNALSTIGSITFGNNYKLILNERYGIGNLLDSSGKIILSSNSYPSPMSNGGTLASCLHLVYTPAGVLPPWYTDLSGYY